MWPSPALPSLCFGGSERAGRGYPREKGSAGARDAGLGRSCSSSRTAELSCRCSFSGFGWFLLPSPSAHGAISCLPVFPAEALAARSHPSASRAVGPLSFLPAPGSSCAGGTAPCARRAVSLQQGGGSAFGSQRERNGFAAGGVNGLPHCPSCSLTSPPFVARRVGASQVKSPPVSPLWSPLCKWEIVGK